LFTKLKLSEVCYCRCCQQWYF